MQISESNILLLSFITLVSVGVWKLSKFLKNYLDNYSEKISSDINESERVKIEAIKHFEEMQKKMEKAQNDAKIIILESQREIENLLQNGHLDIENEIKNAIHISENKMKKEENKIVSHFKKNLMDSVIELVEKYIGNDKNIASKKKIEIKFDNIDELKKLSGNGTIN